MPNTIADNLRRLKATVPAISNAIIAKGGTVNAGDGLEEFPDDINTIPTANLRTLDVTENGTYYESTPTEITSTSFPITLNDSLGTNLLDYLISGNMSQSGTPTPTTPIQPSECGERTGNLFDISAYSSYTTGISNIVTTSNSITYTATSALLAIRYFFPLNTTDIFTIQLGSESSKVRLELRYRKNGSTVRDTIVVTIGNSYVIRGSEDVDEIQINISNGTSTGTCTASNIMLNAGSTPLPYEPWGIKIPISSANTTTPVYLGEVETTRKIRKLVLDGTENWTYRSGDPANVFFMYLPTAKTGEVAMSNAYPYYSGTDFVDVNDKEFAIIRSNLAIRNSDYQYESQFKAYLAQQYAAGTPVTVWYVLAEPTTGIVNEPIRKIGNYADTVSMEQAGVSIPTNRGNTVIDVETALKPSEMYIKYDQPSEYAGYNIVNVNVQTSFTPSDEGKVVSNGTLVAQTPLSQDITQNGTYDTTLNNSITVNVSGGGTMPDRYLTVDQLNENNEPKKISIYGAPGDVFNWFYNDRSSTTNSFEKVEEIVLDEDFASIGQNSTFRYFNELKTISLPSQITDIPAYTFQGCSSLVSGFDLTNIETIGNYAFDQCSSLDINADLSKVQTIPQYAFQDCENLTTVKITNQTTSINYKAFYNCKKMNGDIDLSNVTYLGEASFYNCNSIDKPLDVSNVATIRGNTFDGCKKVPSITLKDNFVLNSNSSQRVFADCESLTSILQPATWPYNTVPYGTYSGCINLEQSFDLTGATTIESEAFMNCKKMLNPTVGTISSLGAKAFFGCSSITEFHFNAGSTVSYIYEQTFRDCTSLASITFAQDSRITQFGKYAFANTKITSITAPATLKTISDRCFEDCSDLVEVDLSGSVYNPSYYGLATYLFNNCINLTTVKFPATLEAQIGAYTFRNCPKLLSIDCPKGIGRLDTQSFAESSIEEIPQLTTGVTSLPTECFKDSGLKRIVIPDQITSINQQCFEGCTKLTSVIFHETKNITLSSYAFSGCAALDEIIIPSNVKVSSQVFAQDGYEGGVKRVYIKGTSDSKLNSSTFYRNTSITDVYFQWSQPSGEPPRYGLREEATIHYDWNPDAV